MLLVLVAFYDLGVLLFFKYINNEVFRELKSKSFSDNSLIISLGTNVKNLLRLWM